MENRQDEAASATEADKKADFDASMYINDKTDPQSQQSIETLTRLLNAGKRREEFLVRNNDIDKATIKALNKEILQLREERDEARFKHEEALNKIQGFEKYQATDAKKQSDKLKTARVKINELTLEIETYKKEKEELQKSLRERQQKCPSSVTESAATSVGSLVPEAEASGGGPPAEAVVARVHQGTPRMRRGASSRNTATRSSRLTRSAARSTMRTPEDASQGRGDGAKQN